jgi:hypothetical protein
MEFGVEEIRNAIGERSERGKTIEMSKTRIVGVFGCE